MRADVPGVNQLVDLPQSDSGESKLTSIMNTRSNNHHTHEESVFVSDVSLDIYFEGLFARFCVSKCDSMRRLIRQSCALLADRKGLTNSANAIKRVTLLEKEKVAEVSSTNKIKFG